MWSLGVFFTSLEQEFQWSRSVISGGYTCLIIGHSISAIVAGKLADKNAARPTLLMSALLAGPSLALCSRMASAGQFYALFLMTGLGTGATVSIPTSTVQRWFIGRPHSGTALAIVMSGIGIGGLLFAPLFQHLIGEIGWRSTLAGAGAIFLLMVGGAGLPKRPYIGHHFSGFNISDSDGQPSTTIPLRKLVFTRRYLLVVGVTFVAFLAFQVLSVHLIPYASDVGVPANTAALALGAVGGASVPGRFLSGALSEKLGWSRTLAGALLGTSLAILSLLFVSQAWMILPAVALFGVCHGMRAVAVLGLLGRSFGTESLGVLIGLTIAVGQLFSAPGPYIVGFWFDLGYSYTATFLAIAMGLLLGALLVLLMNTQDHPLSKNAKPSTTSI
jgi:MFS family permease